MGFQLSQDSPWVGEYAEDDAFRFFEAISPTHGLFGYGGRAWEFEHFIFRGHGRDDFSLLPGAFRTKTKLLWNRAWREVPLPNLAEQIWAEVTTLDAFFRVCDRQGLAIPEDSQALRHLLRKWMELNPPLHGDEPVSWPPDEFVSMIALAQHYGLPTRLLDWTRSAAPRERRPDGGGAAAARE